MDGAIDYSKTAAIDGIKKHGVNYSFTKLNHYEIIEVFEKARIKKGLNKSQLSKMSGFGDSAYNKIVLGSRLSHRSFDAFCKALKVLHYDNSVQSKIEFNNNQESMNDEQMALYLKSKGWKLQRPVTTITYVEL